MEAHGFRLTEFNNNTYFLSGHPAIRLVGIQDDEKIMLYAIKSGANAYAVKYISSPDTYLTYLASAQQMLDSFQVINDNDNNNVDASQINIKRVTGLI
jgi:hypothetical protein